MPLAMSSKELRPAQVLTRLDGPAMNRDMKTRHVRHAAIIAASFWLLGAPMKARGQGNTWTGSSLQRMVEAAHWRIGYLRINAAVMLGNVGYDSDVYYGYLADPVRDFTLAFSSPVQLLLPLGKNIVVDIIETPQYLYYLDTDNERAWNNMFQGQVHFAMDRLYFRGGGGLANIRQRLSPELNINIRQKENSIDGLALWQVSLKTSLAVLYKSVEFDHGDAEFAGTRLADTLNRKEGHYDAVVYIQPNPRVRLFADGEYGTYAFTEAVSAHKDARSYGVYGGFSVIPPLEEKRQISGVQGSLRLGFKRLDVSAPDQVDGSGFTGAFNLSAGLLKRTTGRAFFSRDFQFSIYAGATYYVSVVYGGGITRLLSKHATFSYDLSFGHSKYPENGTDGGTPPGITNRYTTHTITLNVKLARSLGITFMGSLGQRTTEDSGGTRNRNFYGFSLTYGTPPQAISAPLSVGGAPR